MLSNATIATLVAVAAPEDRALKLLRSIESRWTAAHSRWFRGYDAGAEDATAREEMRRLFAMLGRATRLHMREHERMVATSDAALKAARKRGEY